MEAVRRCVETAEWSPIPGRVEASQWEPGVYQYYELGGIPEGLTIDLSGYARLVKMEKGYFGVT